MKTVRLALCITLSLMFLSPVLAQRNKYGGAKLISMPEYNLSDTDKAAGIDGELSLMVRIDKSGKVRTPRFGPAPSGHAAQNWTIPLKGCAMTFAKR